MFTILTKPLQHREAFQNFDITNGNIYLCLLQPKELADAALYLPIPAPILTECQQPGPQKFESHEGFDFISLNIPSTQDLLAPNRRVCIYFTTALLVIISEQTETLLESAQNLSTATADVYLGKVLFTFLDDLTRYDATCLESLEQDISQLEEDLLNDIKQDYTKAIVLLRKKLLVLKRYYEQLFNIAEAIEENENGLIHKKSLRYFRMLTNRIDRLSHTVLNLRDYVTQVREAYQAQVDISLNNVMKLFTVITAIFLPLSLIVGWYGMNFAMPEYDWIFGYPAVIILSIIVVAISFFLFKKHKWF